MSDLIPIERIENKILLIRGKKVLLDSDLAELYNVDTGQLKRQVRRNIERFPEDFMFELNKEEYDSLRCQTGILKRGRHSKYLPFAFTEQGVAMLSSVLSSKQAIQVNIIIVRAFVKMRELLLNNIKMAEKLRDIEERMDTQEMNTIIIMDKLRTLTSPSKKKTKKIGFDTKK